MSITGVSDSGKSVNQTVNDTLERLGETDHIRETIKNTRLKENVKDSNSSVNSNIGVCNSSKLLSSAFFETIL